jgi:hypothetical protein
MCHNVTRRRPPTPAPDETDEPEKKERVIHTRVPESLEAELRQRAQELGMSVSNLVRNVLGHAFGLVGDVVADSHAIARAARGENFGRRRGEKGHPEYASDLEKALRMRPSQREPDPEPEEVIAWQPIVLAKNAICTRCNDINAICSRCNDILPKGSEGAIAIGGDRAIVCTKCLAELRK